MKKYFPFSLFLFLYLIIFLFSNCSEENVTQTIEKEISFSSYHISGCNSTGLKKIIQNGECFDYSFDDTLKIDFCVSGNCCPDSQRFVTNYSINSDTILVSVADTAANLCWCNCNYTIHLELSNLLEERYLFVCDYATQYNSFEYRESVSK